MASVPSSRSLPAMEMLDLGAHCSETTCNQLDFLPFRCPCCFLQFCGSHFRPLEGHKCSKYDPQKIDNRIPACPLCKQGINITSGEDPNIPMDRHLSTSCAVLAPNGLARKKTKPANCCKASRCKTKMIQPIRCPSCKLDFCPTHRNPKDHACPSITLAQVRPTPSTSLEAVRRVRLKAAEAMQRTTSSSLVKKVIIEISDSSDDEAPASKPLIGNKSQQSNKSSASEKNKANRKQESDSEIEFISSTPAVKKAMSRLPIKLSAEERAKAKRVKAERQSALKALHVRAQKGILSEKEKVDYATLKAVEAREGNTNDGCYIL